MSVEQFHPAVDTWFRSCFDQPTKVQQLAWPAIKNGNHTLLAAPTGSGKTLAAFLAAIDDLVRESVAGNLPDETRVLYVSPLKALSNDIEKNLQQPLQGIAGLLSQESLATQQNLLPQPEVSGEVISAIRAAVRTGDTPASERARMRRTPPHILVTTPESLYILLTSESGRQMLSTVRTVIVDELHAVAGNKRGAHLSLSLERLDGLCEKSPVRIGISATQKPIEKMAQFLVGRRTDECTIVDTGFVRERDLELVLPSSDLQPVMAAEVWTEIYDRLAELIHEHRSTLVFVNTRRLAERVARHLAERLGETAVTAHHGSLAREHRLDAEQRLKSGQLKALVATASLELGIDIGDVDLTCQLASPRAIAVFLQRVGRSGHGVAEIPKGRLFPMTRDDLLECTALLDSVRREELDAVHLQGPALDVLAQQIVAEVAAREWSTEDLFQLFTQAWPYCDLSRDTFDQVIRMLADGYTTRRGRQALYIHHDAVNGRLRARRGARLVSITNGGAIPDQFDYNVVLLPQEFSIGSLNEDFAFESLPGDIFQLGNTSYRILKIEMGKVLVEDAQGQPPNIPFWVGEALGRTDELSFSVSRLREKISQLLDEGVEPARQWLESTLGLARSASEQLIEYLAGAKMALGVMPTQTDIVLERFFDEVGDTHLVIHSSFGSRLNRAWGLALRKRFCRKFNFELQAAALEDSIVLSLGPTHSFPLEEVAGYLKSGSVRQVLVQAMLNAPMFPARWRWTASIALAVRRNRNGKRIPPYFQRSDAEDLMAVVFPDQLACAENIAGDRELPDHPLVDQTVHDCLHEVMDIDGLETVLEKIADGKIAVTVRDLTSPSPLAQEILTARPYAFLDDAPAEERRTQAVRARHLLDPEEAANLGRLDPEVIKSVCENAWPDARDADELHDALVLSGFVTEAEIRQAENFECKSVSLERWGVLLAELVEQRRATIATTSPGTRIWVAAERLAQLQAALPTLLLDPEIDPVIIGGRGNADNHSDALRELIRSRLETLGPVTTAELTAPLGIEEAQVQMALLELESEGYAMRGQYRGSNPAIEEWCDRRLLARIHRDTITTLRRKTRPVSPAVFMQFLFRWHEMGDVRGSGPNSLRAAVGRLQGFPIPAVAWEATVLPHRVENYSRSHLDELLGSGQFFWSRPRIDSGKKQSKAGPVRSTPIMLIDRLDIDHWLPLLTPGKADLLSLSEHAKMLCSVLAENGASFFVDLVRSTGLLRTQVESTLAELVSWGLVTSDTFAGLRVLTTPSSKRASFSRPRRRRSVSVDTAGRWVLVEQGLHLSRVADNERSGYSDASVEHVARVLLDRYGVVFRSLLHRESRLLPPWRQLARVYRRLEARGEIRGGRFVNGFSGEHFARPEAVDSLRAVQKNGEGQREFIVSAADPLNLAGIITPGVRVPVAPRNRLLYRDGVPVAIYVAGEFEWLESPDPAGEWAARNFLIRNDPGLTYVPGPYRPS